VGPALGPGVGPRVAPRVGPGVEPGTGQHAEPRVGPGKGPGVGSKVVPSVEARVQEWGLKQAQTWFGARARSSCWLWRGARNAPRCRAHNCAQGWAWCGAWCKSTCWAQGGATERSQCCVLSDVQCGGTGPGVGPYPRLSLVWCQSKVHLLPLVWDLVWAKARAQLCGWMFTPVACLGLDLMWSQDHVKAFSLMQGQG